MHTLRSTIARRIAATALTAATLAACTSSLNPADQPIEGAAFGFDTACPDPIGPNADICLTELPNGYTVIYRPGSSDRPSLHLDPGGPLIELRSMGQLVSEAADREELNNRVIFGVVAPEPARIETECAEATSETLAEACDLARIRTLYTNEYAKAVETVRQALTPSHSLDILGSSVAATRWPLMIQRGVAPSVRHGVIISPFSPGQAATDVTQSVENMARMLFTAGIRDGCRTEACFATVDLFAYAEECSRNECAVDSDLADLTGISESDALAGLIGLAPNVDINAPQIARWLEEGDDASVTSALQRGARSYRGQDLLGDNHLDGIHLLSMSCPALMAETTELTDTFRACDNEDKLPPTGADRSNMFGHNDLNPQTMCFVSTQPDVVLGLAANGGYLFGNGSASATRKEHLGHGDLSFGLAIYLETLNAPQTCSR